jgi:hypothetical protein
MRKEQNPTARMPPMKPRIVIGELVHGPLHRNSEAYETLAISEMLGVL